MSIDQLVYGWRRKPTPTPTPAPTPAPAPLPPAPVPPPTPTPAPSSPYASALVWRAEGNPSPAVKQITSTEIGFDIPQGPEYIVYLSTAGRDLTSAKEIVVRYRVEGLGVVVPHRPDANQTFTQLGLFFQRQGDNLSGTGVYAGYRWYSPTVNSPIKAGVFELRAPFSGIWPGVQGGMTSATNPSGFAAARRECSKIALTFGNDSGRAHAVAARGPVRFILEDFKII